MGDTEYIYGEANGSSYFDDVVDGGAQPAKRRTHWDPRFQIRDIAGCVEVGVVPASTEKSTDETGIWDPADGRFIQLTRDGCNRAIRALREARDAAFGKDQ